MTNGAKPNYYGLPVLKRPHWKWEVVLYFWIGGIAAGAYVISAVADLFGSESDRATAKAGRLIAAPLMALAPVLLIKDLGRPSRFLNMLRIFKLKSPMSVGSWGLAAFGGLAMLSAALEMLPAGRAARRLVAVPGSLAALFVGGYTGVLISATAIPIWFKNRFLWGPTFLASAFSTGIAAVQALLAARPDTDDAALLRLERAHVMSLATEASLLAASVVRLGPTARPLTRGKWSTLFWPGALGLGIGVPLLAGILPCRAALRLPGAVCGLLGGLALRCCVVYAGQESADDPEAYL